MKWWNFFLFFSLVIAGVKSQGSDNCENSYNCDVSEDKFMVKVTCARKEDGTFEDCACEEGGQSCPPDGAWYDGVTADNIETKCEEICKGETEFGVDSKQCAFYKYVQNNQFQAPPNAKMCYIMNDEQCASTGGTCQPSHCNSGGVNCNGVDPVTTTPAPDATECTVVDGFK